MIEKLKKISGFRFFYDKDLNFFKDKYKLHIHPVMKKGENIESNVQILCKKCNLFKKDNL